MDETTQAVRNYVDAVLARIPRAMPERRRIAEDVRLHITERVEAGQDVHEALRHMGPPEQVARAYLGEVRRPIATPGQRVAAFLIDLALGMVVVIPGISFWFGTAVLLSPDAMGISVWAYLPMVLLIALGLSALLLSAIYFPVAEAYFGQTLGKRLLGLCVTTESGEQIGWGAAFLRRLPFFLEFFWLDALFALFTRKRQRAFDMVAKTLVVRVS